ncbi:adenylate kinase [Phreatobacter oligotrophus]|uniref:Adenylate kinase family enzyme n=1 Tax=Phreatobacter oligotrophus TaxID=1122261 RepID=A0A2T4ZI63_9HYPH|nr:adenylate kinase [Phreatobacter oligotrophus]PTM61673.1 adenylate kinase family enzyme [Phreatobacter oligotrophus]
MERVVVIGNSGGGKSTLARRLAARLALPCHEIDAILWGPGWVPTPVEAYEAEHDRLIAGDRWIIEGLGRRESVPRRLRRATDIVLIDLPLWRHFQLAAERQIAWAMGKLPHPPGGLGDMPPTESLFRTIDEVDREWMPVIRDETSRCATAGATVHRIQSLDALNAF